MSFKKMFEKSILKIFRKKFTQNFIEKMYNKKPDLHDLQPKTSKYSPLM